MGKGVRYIIRQSIPRELEMFLLEKRIMKKYVERVYQYSYLKRRKDRPQENIACACDHIMRCARRIMSAFPWRDTPEGHIYWSKVHVQFLEYEHSLQ